MNFEKTPGELVAEVRMERAASFRGALLIVEGLDDKKFWQSLTLQKKCRILESRAKSCTLQAIQQLDKLGEIAGILFIVDDDFDLYFQRRIQHSSLLYTDAHDLEAMLLRSNAVHSVLMEYATGKSVETFESAKGRSVQDVVFEQAIPLGRLRIRAQAEGWPISFDSFTAYKVYDVGAFAFSEENLLTFLRATMPNLTREALAAVMQEPIECEPRYLCHGFDLLTIFCILLRGPLGVTHIGWKKLLAALRLAFTSTDLQQTVLYEQIRTWEKCESVKVLA